VTDNISFAQVIDHASRANPYPLYTRLRETPVARQDNGIYIVTTHEEIRSLLFDRRMSSEILPKWAHARTGNPVMDWIINPIKDRISEKHRPFAFRDPPDHDILRRLVMLQFSQERIWGMRGRIDAIVDGLIVKIQDRRGIDLVNDFCYPLPVCVICELLGVPAEDEPKFHGWATTLAAVNEPDELKGKAPLNKIVTDYDAIGDYLGSLIKAKRKHPADDILSGLVTYNDKNAGGMGRYDLIATAVLLLVAGHETTVNLISNAMLTLLRHPKILARLRAEPNLAPRLIEEILRFDPPVQFVNRKALDEIDIACAHIPKGAPIILLLASGNRDPKRYCNPDHFDPDRTNNQHFGFGGGLHSCIGAKLARIEAETALVALVRRLVNPCLAADPPPYRPGAFLRGPAHLELTIDGVD
jgi:cytochrome P450